MRCKISWEKVDSEFRGVCLKQGKNNIYKQTNIKCIVSNEVLILHNCVSQCILF